MDLISKMFVLRTNNEFLAHLYDKRNPTDDELDAAARIEQLETANTDLTAQLCRMDKATNLLVERVRIIALKVTQP